MRRKSRTYTWLVLHRKMDRRTKIIVKTNVYLDRVRGELYRGECSCSIASSWYSDENHSGLILVRHTKSLVKSQDRSECHLFLCNNYLSTVQVRVINPVWPTRPCCQCLFDPLISIYICPSIHRNFEMWEAPNKISAPIEMVVKRTGISLLFDKRRSFYRVQLPR